MTPKKPLSPAESEAVTVEGAIGAPILYFDEISAVGVGGGVGRILLSAFVQEVGPDGELHTRKVAVAHLRANGVAFHRLKDAIGQMELLAAPASGGTN